MNTPTKLLDTSYTSQLPPHFTLPFEDCEIVIVSDGVLNAGRPDGLFSEVSSDEVERRLWRSFLPQDKIILEENILILNSPERRILFDTGVGTSQTFGPGAGRLQATLRTAGIALSGVSPSNN